LDPNCEEIARDDDGGLGTLSLLGAPIPFTGTYTVVVTSFGPVATGWYLLLVDT
jgi:hypothetical protein